jgi:hypothetical protein
VLDAAVTVRLVGESINGGAGVMYATDGSYGVMDSVEEERTLPASQFPMEATVAPRFRYSLVGSEAS